MKKKWKLLKKAYDNYPKDTKCQWVEFGSVMYCTGEYYFSNEYGVTRIHDSNGYAIFDGQDWAEIITEKTESVLIGKSEDGLNVYENDPLQSVWLSDNKWILGIYHDHAKGIVSNSETTKFFSTREAAKKWIEEQNKPKEIVIDGIPRATISFDGVILSTLTNYISSKRLEEIWEAYQSLK